MQIKQICKKQKSVVEIEALRIQIEMYKISVHPYVVRLLDYFEDKEYIYLCLEKYYGSTLDHYFEVNSSKIKEDEIIKYAITIGTTLEYLHDNGILLRNL